MAWCFVSDTLNVHVVDLQSMSRTTRVRKLTEGQKMKTVKAHFEDDVEKLLSLDTFEAESEFSEGLDKVTESRTAFVKLFNDKEYKVKFLEDRIEHDVEEDEMRKFHKLK